MAKAIYCYLFDSLIFLKSRWRYAGETRYEEMQIRAQTDGTTVHALENSTVHMHITEGTWKN